MRTRLKMSTKRRMFRGQYPRNVECRGVGLGYRILDSEGVRPELGRNVGLKDDVKKYVRNKIGSRVYTN